MLVGRLTDIIAPPRMGTAFRWNLASSWVGQVGDGIALAAGPLLVATQTRSPVLIAAAAVVQRLPGLAVGLYAGAVADRVDRRRVVIVANLARLLALVALVTALLTGTLSIGLLLGLLLLVGTAEVFADTGWRAILPMIVDPADLGLANARQMSGFLVANQLIGPAVGAALFALGSAVPFGVHVLSLLLAVALFSRVELPAAGAGRPAQHAGRDILDGLRWIRHHAAVRTLTLVILVFNITWGAPWGVLVYWAQERLGVGPVGFGLLTTASAVGGIASVLAYGWLERRIPLGRLMKACLTLEVLTHLALALTTSWVVAMAVMAMFGAYAFVWASLSSAVRQRATPQEYQGRVGSVYWVGLVGGLLVGQALGGVIADRFGAAAPFWFAFAGAGLTLVLVWRRLDLIAHADAAEV
ncbi:putative MFS family arabinose efflux permease [Phycicoccus duodecadis]|uniref:Putative MFS family arabinose efflux permease n=1 Tax=Phycicoccus duodecadis TaxID=173053 RepID=A0A2N3YG69_9MICO|nr:putative MFS family arabinose efflux permease [Phycicoccus duodecadis]